MYEEERPRRRAEVRRNGDDTRDRRRRRRSSSADADDGGFPMWKTGAVLAVVGICFAVLYPKMLHPLLSQLFGGGGGEPRNEEPHSPHHPHMGMRAGMKVPPNAAHIHAGGGGRMGGAGGGDGGGGGGGKGGWGWMLPFYSFGVIGFLIYMLTKVIFKEPKKRRRGGGSDRYDTRYSGRRDRFDAVGGGGHSSADGSASDDEDLPPGRMSRHQLKNLQKKLHDTESAMHKILGQLESISTGNVKPETAESVRQMTLDTLNNLQTGDIASRLGPAFEGDDSEAEAEEERLRNDEANRAVIPDLDRAIQEFKNLTAAYAEQRLKEAEAAAKVERDDEDDGERPVAPETLTRVVDAVNSLGQVSSHTEDETSSSEEDDDDDEDDLDDVDAGNDGHHPNGVAEAKTPDREDKAEQHKSDHKEPHEHASDAEEEATCSGTADGDVVEGRFDVMEGEDPELKLPEPEGTIIHLQDKADRSLDAGAKTTGRVRNRKRRKS